MLFAAPLVLLGLLVLPALWFLLRLTPPAPRREVFPAVRLLHGLLAAEETPARTPWWLLALRLAAAALLILGLAGPELRPSAVLPGTGPVLLVLDTGWATAPDWAARQRAARAVLQRAAAAGRLVALLATAPGAEGAAPRVSALLPAAIQRARVAALVPEPWPADRRADAAALAALAARCRRGRDLGGGCPAGVVYLADGLTDGPGNRRFAAALGAIGPVRELRPAARPLLLLPPATRGAALLVRLAAPPAPHAQTVAVLGETAAGQPLAETRLAIRPGAAESTAPLRLPVALRNRLARLVLPGIASAGAVVLLDERWRRRPVGLAAADRGRANTPFLGALYYVSRALAPYAALREAPLAALLHRRLAAIVLADDPLPPGPERAALIAWVRRGGELIRFAGPRTVAAAASAAAGSDASGSAASGSAPPANTAPAGAADPLLPVRLLAGDRALGGAMSWGRPEGLAPFPPGSPFAGLAVPADVTVRTQVLARPSAALPGRTWATLTDGTPLVTAKPLGRGRVVLFHVTANDAWSNLPLSGLFVAMLRRLVALSAGVATPPGHAVLAPWRTLDGMGVTGRPPPAAQGLAADRFTTTPVSARHPPGLYGPRGARMALNLAVGMGLPVAAPPVAGAEVGGFAALAPGVALGPWLLALAAALLVADLLLSLGLRGVLRRGGPAAGAGLGAGAVLLGLGLGLAGPARAQGPSMEAPPMGVPPPALGTRLGYVQTGDARVDRISRQGLLGLSEFVNAHTAAHLHAPDPVVPGRTDLSFYPLLYWPIVPGAAALPAGGAAALNRFMARDGILVIDTGAAAAGGAPAPAALATLRRLARGLAIPPLTPLSIRHVLGRSFFLLRTYPGRYAGGTVWVVRHADRGSDDVSPVVIGSNDWAAAWAVDRDGRAPYATIPGGTLQRVLAFRFGVNLVMYALTGNYKGDQLQMQAILRRLGG